MPDENTILTEKTDTEVGGEEKNQEAVETEEKSSEEKLKDRYTEDDKDEKEADNDEKDADESEDKKAEYEDFTLPEGVTADEGIMSSFKDLAKGIDLKQEDAQKLVDLGAKMMEQQNDAIRQAHAEQVEQWAKDAEADGELKGDFKANVGLAKKALDNFGSPELVEMLNETGMGNHPEVIKAFWKIGKAIGEDSFHEGKQGNPMEGLTPQQKIEANYKKNKK